MKELVTSQIFIMYLIIINLIGFVIMFVDKNKAKRGGWRIPENTLFIITAIGGGIGTISGMYLFRHKTKKALFRFGFPFLLIMDILLIIWVMVTF